MKFLALGRAVMFSPNMADKDALILQSVIDLLRAEGHEVNALQEEQWVSLPLEASSHYDLVFGMYRHEQTLSRLEQLEQQYAIRCFPSPEAIRNADRIRLVQIMIEATIPMPRTRILKDTTNSPFGIEAGHWLKRGHGCAEVPEDVVFVKNADEERIAFSSFAARGISDIVASEHLDGDLIKFYGVEGTGFFDWAYAPLTQGKFRLEAHNSPHRGYAFETDRLCADAGRLASLTGIAVYGGDCIVGADGVARIIDFNDWPSFSRCREQASLAIAKRIKQQL